MCYRLPSRFRVCFNTKHCDLHFDCVSDGISVRVFATEHLAEDYVGIPMEGTFHVYDYISDALESAASDGVPRYGCCVTDQLRNICVSSEGVRDAANRVFVRSVMNFVIGDEGKIYVR